MTILFVRCVIIFITISIRISISVSFIIIRIRYNCRISLLFIWSSLVFNSFSLVIDRNWICLIFLWMPSWNSIILCMVFRTCWILSRIRCWVISIINNYRINFWRCYGLWFRRSDYRNNLWFYNRSRRLGTNNLNYLVIWRYRCRTTTRWFPACLILEITWWVFNWIKRANLINSTLWRICTIPNWSIRACYVTRLI